MSNVFSRLAPYGYIHHRALNDFAAMAQAERCIQKYPDKVQVLEGDVCWNFSAGRSDLYFRHPSYFVDTLAAGEIDRLRSERRLVTLEDLLEHDTPKHHYVIELKVGVGDTAVALTRLIETLQQRCRDRFWIDGFSYRLLGLVKQIDPSVCTTVHTEYVAKGKILLDAPEWPPFRTLRLRDLAHVDGVALRKRFSDDYMARACADIRDSGLALLLSRLFTVRDYELSREWGAIAGYPKPPFDEIMHADSERERSHAMGVA